MYTKGRLQQMLAEMQIIVLVRLHRLADVAFYPWVAAHVMCDGM